MSNNTVEYAAYIGRVAINNADEYITTKTIEIDSRGFPLLPALPIVGNFYIVDFSKIWYKPILQHLDMVAMELCYHFNMRVFLDGDAILIVSPLSISEVETAVDKVGNGIIDVIRAFMCFPAYANANKHMRPFHALDF